MGITLFFLFQLPRLQIDNDTMNFVPKNDSALVALENFEDQYGSALIMDLVVINPYGSIITKEGLNAIQKITETLENIEGVLEIQSITNTDYINGSQGTLEVSSLAEEKNGKLLLGDEIRCRLNSWEMYESLLLSTNEHSTQVLVSLDDDLEVKDRERIYNRVREKASEIIPSNYSYYLAGLPATTIQISKNMKKDLTLLIPFVIVVVLLILYLSFRRFGGVLLPTLNVIISTIWTVGMMAMTNTPMTILGSIIPVLMIAVGSAYGIHLVSHYYDELDSVNNSNRENNIKIVWHSVKLTGIPILLASLTTMAGFGSLAVSSVLPMKSFGIFTSFGVGSALIVALVLIPSLLLIRPGRPKKGKGSEKPDNPLFAGLAGFSVNRKGVLITFSLTAIIISACFIPHIVVDNNLTAYFKETTEVRKSERFIRENFVGTNSFNMLIYGEEKGTLNNPEILLFMDNFKSWILENYTEVGKVLSYSDFIKRMNQVLHENTPGKVQLGGGSSKATDYTRKSQSVWDTDFDNSFGNDSFDNKESSSDSGSFFTDTAGENISEPVKDTIDENFDNNADMSGFMDALWNSWLTDPDKFMVSLAKMINHKGMNYYEIPENPEKYKLKNNKDLSNLISQYLILYSGNLSSWSNEVLEPSQARMSVQLKVNGSNFTDRIIPELRNYADKMLPEGYTLSFAGVALVQSSLTHRIVKSAVRSILLSILLVFIMLSITYRSLLAGIIGIVPLSLTVLINFGVMGLTKIPLDISTAMVGSIAIGIGIDYTIHFISGYKFHYRVDRSPVEITHLTMKSSGKAIIFNALSVAAGFSVLIFSQFNPLMYLGILIVITMAVSSLASLTLLPLLLNTLKPKFLNNKTTEGESK